MKKKFMALNKKIMQIISNGKIELSSNSYINVGLLLERKLGIPTNDLAVPDIDGIEIKTSRSNSNLPISLFSCTCDGPDFYELKRFVSRFGVYDHEFKDTKVLYITLSADHFSSWGKYLKMKLYIDQNKKKIFIMVANSNGKIIEKRSFWNFATLEEIMLRKLNFLCFCQCELKYEKNKRYCKFEDVQYLKYCGFDHFVELLYKGDIRVNIKYGVHKNGIKKGSSYNHGTAFIIKKSALGKLFDNYNFGQKK